MLDFLVIATRSGKRGIIEIYPKFIIKKSSDLIRDIVIARDMGCDLGIEGHEIFGMALIHHMNPVRPEDIRRRADWILDPEYLITTIHETHQAIHYGDENLLMTTPTVRAPNDTCPWKHN